MVDPSLPGSELIREGLNDLSRGELTEFALLYEHLSKSDSDSAHARYNALIRRLVSFERAAECADRRALEAFLAGR